MAESVQTPAAVAATVGQREAPTAPPPKSTGPQPAEGAKGRPTGRVDTGPDKTGNKNGGKETEQPQDGDTEGAVAGEVAGPEEAAAAAAPPLRIGRHAQPGVLQDALHPIVIDAVLTEGENSADVRLVADVSNAVLIGSDADVVNAVIGADVVLERLELHHRRAPPSVIGR